MGIMYGKLGTFKYSIPFARLSGAWKPARMYQRISGAWKPTSVAGIVEVITLTWTTAHLHYQAAPFMEGDLGSASASMMLTTDNVGGVYDARMYIYGDVTVTIPQPTLILQSDTETLIKTWDDSYYDSGSNVTVFTVGGGDALGLFNFLSTRNGQTVSAGIYSPY